MAAKAADVQRLVIVESPAKAKTIAGYLGPGYDVEASVGHVRDLASKASELPESDRRKPWAKYAVNVDDDFQAFYVVHDSKKAKVAELKRLLKDADELILATDEDREGEAIAWHLVEVLRPKVPIRRMVFNEITKDAIQRAAQNTRDIDMALVDAQETRRIIDRLYGYPVSEVLWKKIGREARSAGRVQSVAVRLVVDRERERIAFVRASYWDIHGVFDPEAFGASLVSVDGRRVASGQDFSQDGRLTRADAVILDEVSVTSLAAGLSGAQFTVRSVEEKPGTRRPAAPFMTSTLQQEASKKFRWGAQRTMRVAQGLYERGFITYMRTDSTTLSEQALTAARTQARQLYGPDYVPDTPRRHDRKVKNAQEAHEAIRPAGDAFRTPAEVSGELVGDEFALYDLIWKRTVASQMVDARTATTTIRLGAGAADGRDAEFSASGTVVLFPGWLAAYEEIAEDDQSSDSEDPQDRRLPRLATGDVVTARELQPRGHETKPPARYTEASLVRALEERGIGRPSTYASIMSTILDRGYVWKKGTAMVPSFAAFAVVRLLEEHFTDLIDYEFTARMEEMLDLISDGHADRDTQLGVFWNGGVTEGREFPGIRTLTGDLSAIDAREISTFPIAGSEAVLRVGKYGPYLERGETRANIPVDLAPDELTAAMAEDLLSRPSGDRVLGVDPESGQTVVARVGRFGPYVAELLPEGAPKTAKPKMASIFKDMDITTIDLDTAVLLLSLPRVVGVDPADGQEITAQNGRYGAYIRRGGPESKDTRPLPDEASIFTIDVDGALALLAQPKGRRGATGPKPPLRDLGVDPISGRQILVKDGRFGPYVTDGEINATLRRADNPETVTLDRASDLLAEKRATGPAPAAKAPRGRSAKPPTLTARTVSKKATAKKATAKTTAKTTAKKATAKTTAKKATAKTTAKKATAKTTAKKAAAKQAATTPA